MPVNSAKLSAARSDLAALAYGILPCRGCVDAPGFALQVARFPGRHPAGVKERAKIVMTDTEPGPEPEQPPVPTKARSKSASGSASYAIIETGGKQYRVAPGDKVRVETVPMEVGAELELSGLKAVSTDEGKLLLGNDVANAKLTATVSGHGRGQKLIVFKFKRKKQYKRTYGHRQNYTEVTINQVLV